MLCNPSLRTDKRNSRHATMFFKSSNWAIMLRKQQKVVVVGKFLVHLITVQYPVRRNKFAQVLRMSTIRKKTGNSKTMDSQAVL